MCNFHYLGYYCSPNLFIPQNSTQDQYPASQLFLAALSGQPWQIFGRQDCHSAVVANIRPPCTILQNPTGKTSVLAFFALSAASLAPAPEAPPFGAGASGVCLLGERCLLFFLSSSVSFSCRGSFWSPPIGASPCAAKESSFSSAFVFVKSS